MLILKRPRHLLFAGTVVGTLAHRAESMECTPPSFSDDDKRYSHRQRGRRLEIDGFSSPPREIRIATSGTGPAGRSREGTSRVMNRNVVTGGRTRKFKVTQEILKGERTMDSTRLPTQPNTKVSGNPKKRTMWIKPTAWSHGRPIRAPKGKCAAMLTTSDSIRMSDDSLPANALSSSLLDGNRTAVKGSERRGIIATTPAEALITPKGFVDRTREPIPGHKRT